jgi:hypothetical protein
MIPKTHAMRVLIAGVVWSVACGDSSTSPSLMKDEPPAASSSSGGSGALGNGSAPVDTSACNTVRGKVFDPAGKVALSGVTVYVPKGPLVAPVDGVTCGRCGAPVAAFAATLTDASGSFVLPNVPGAPATRLVLETGKWRREVELPGVQGCKEIVADDPNVMRLPRNASEGSLPHIAIVAGGADALQCLVRKIGVSDSEFGTAGDANAHVHLFKNVGGTQALASGKALAPASALFSGKALDAYDAALVNCDGIVEDTRTTPAPWLSAMEAYAAKGGRAFFSHFMSFFVRGSALASVSGLASILANNGNNLTSPFVADVNMSFPKGKIFGEWLTHVGASATPGKLPVTAAERLVTSVNAAAGATSWVDSANGVEETTGRSLGPLVQYFSTNMPAGQPATKQCGRYVVSDLHVSGGGAGPFPTSCSAGELTPQEKALEFMLFDLSSCVAEDKDPIAPPVIK